MAQYSLPFVSVKNSRMECGILISFALRKISSLGSLRNAVKRNFYPNGFCSLFFRMTLVAVKSCGLLIQNSVASRTLLMERGHCSRSSRVFGVKRSRVARATFRKLVCRSLLAAVMAAVAKGLVLRGMKKPRERILV